METRGYREPKRDGHTRQRQHGPYENQEERFERRRASEYFEGESYRGDEDWDDQRSSDLGAGRGFGEQRRSGWRGEEHWSGGGRGPTRGFEGSRWEGSGPRGNEGWGNEMGREAYRTEGSRQSGSFQSGQDYPDTQRGRYAGVGPRNYKRSDDRVREDVCDRLAASPHIDASDLEISVQNGEVTLQGFVSERRMKRLAEDIVEDVAGVRDVTNQIRVQQQVLGSGFESSSMSMSPKDPKNANKV